MWCRVNARVLPDISKNHGDFIFTDLPDPEDEGSLKCQQPLNQEHCGTSHKACIQSNSALTVPNLASAFYLVLEMKDMSLALWQDEIKMVKSKEDKILGLEKQLWLLAANQPISRVTNTIPWSMRMQQACRNCCATLPPQWGRPALEGDWLMREERTLQLHFYC